MKSLRMFYIIFIVLLCRFAFAQQKYSVPGDYPSIASAISSVADGSTIIVSPGTYRESISINGVGKNLLIKSSGGASQTIFNGDGTRWFLDIQNAVGGSNPKNIVWDGFSFINGYQLGNNGSAVTINNASPCFMNCIFDNNHAIYKGGAVCVYGTTSRPGFVNCTFRNNYSKSTAGAVLIDGEHIQTIFKDCTFENNSNRVEGGNNDAEGGALYFSKSGGYVLNSSFKNNRASYAGGAIMALTWWDSVVQDDLLIRGCVFEGNSSRRITPSGALPPTEGGAIMAENNLKVTVSHCYFTNNAADSGGGIQSYRAHLVITNTVFERCEATGTNLLGSGGAVSVNLNDAGDIDRREAVIDISDTLMHSCKAPVGGGFYYSGDESHSKNGTVTMNNVIVDACESVTNGYSYGNGGGIFLSRSSASADRLMLINNEADYAGGAIVMVQSASLTLNNAVVAGNKAAYDSSLHAASGTSLNDTDTLWAYNGSTTAGEYVFISALPFTLRGRGAFLSYFVMQAEQSPVITPRIGELMAQSGYYAGSVVDHLCTTGSSYTLTSQTLNSAVVSVANGLRGDPDAPYGQIANLPGAVECEQFDNGGEMIGFHDTTTANLGGALRSDGVDIVAASNASDGYYVGWVVPGEWMEYTVNVLQSGTYYVSVHYAAPVESSCSVFVDDLKSAVDVAMPSTGGFGTFSSHQGPTSVDLDAGTHLIRFVATSGAFNCDKMQWSTSIIPSPSPVPGGDSDGLLLMCIPAFTHKSKK